MTSTNTPRTVTVTITTSDPEAHAGARRDLEWLGTVEFPTSQA